jgi:hypothetical protein
VFISNIFCQQVDTTYHNVDFTKVERVFPRVFSQKKNATYIELPTLPENCIFWQFYIGVGKDAEAIYTKAVKNAERKRKNLNSASSAVGSIPNGYGQVASLALTLASQYGVNDLPDYVDYWVVEGFQNVQNFLNDEYFEYIEKGSGPLFSTTIYEYLSGKYYVCLKNNNLKDPIDVNVRFLSASVKNEKTNLNSNNDNNVTSDLASKVVDIASALLTKKKNSQQNENNANTDNTFKQSRHIRPIPKNIKLEEKNILLNESNTRLAKIFDEMDITEEQRKSCKEVLIDHQIKAEEIDKIAFDDPIRGPQIRRNGIQKKMKLTTILGDEKYEIFMQKQRMSSTKTAVSPKQSSISTPILEKDKYIESLRNSCIATGLSTIQQDSTVNIYLEYSTKLNSIDNNGFLTQDDKKKYTDKLRKERTNRLKVIMGEEKFKLLEIIRQNLKEAEKNSIKTPVTN